VINGNASCKKQTPPIGIIRRYEGLFRRSLTVAGKQEKSLKEFGGSKPLTQQFGDQIFNVKGAAGSLFSKKDRYR
jgi:hypothetical protein